MMKKSDLTELMLAIETIRSEKYPEVPKALIEELLLLEYGNQDDRAETQVKIFQMLDNYNETSGK
jgi:hypothetical protein